MSKIIWIGIAKDWAVHEQEKAAFCKRADEDSKAGVNLYVAYSAPGLGKARNPRTNVPNSAGAPFRDLVSLEWNPAYWQDIADRARYAWEYCGITLVNAEGFADSGMYDGRVVNQDALNAHIRRECEQFKDGTSMIWCIGGEVEEGGRPALDRTR